MYDQDAVIRHATECAANHSLAVHSALNLYVSDPINNAESLRVALVSLAAGYEATAHDGSTYTQRVDAARAAVAAWDGPVEKTCTIRAGSVSVRCSLSLAIAAGWHAPYSDDVTRTARSPDHYPERLLGLLGQALDEGRRGDAAIMRVLTLRNQERAATDAQNAAKEVAHNEAKAAGMRLAAEREASKRS